MKTIIKWIFVFVAIILGGYYAVGYINSYFGWYSHEHWKYRKGSHDIDEAKSRGVFVKELKYKVEGYKGDLHNFRPFLEKAYTWGYHTSKETVDWTNTNFPYNLSFSYARTSTFGVIITKDELAKFDSANTSWGYLKEPKLVDTIILQIGGEQIPKGALIKVFE